MTAIWPAVIALLAVGILLILAGRGTRRRHGLADAPTLDLEGKILYSPIHGLSGRPDRIIEEDGLPIPEEWKSAKKVWPSHVAQLGTYFILIEAVARKRPTHGYIVTRDTQRHRIENTPELSAWVLEVAEQIRAERLALREAGLLRSG